MLRSASTRSPRCPTPSDHLPSPAGRLVPGSVGVLWWGVPKDDPAYSVLYVAHNLYTIAGLVAFVVVAVATLRRRGSPLPEPRPADLTLR